jgi:hypothetical protein
MRIIQNIKITNNFMKKIKICLVCAFSPSYMQTSCDGRIRVSKTRQQAL